MTGIKPFELSLWGDRLKNNNQFEEYRVCTVASDTMDSSVGAFDVKLVTKINGDNQLTFSMYYQFIDTIIGEITKNEIAELLCNEAKLKLHYDGKWYDFVIKDTKKDSSKYIYNFTAKDANIQELSKNGYNLSLTEVQSNNVGTVTELGSTVLADTDWVISEDSDTLYETAEELVLLAKINSITDSTDNTINFKKLIIDKQTGKIVEEELEIPTVPATIYVFYSNLENKNTRIQFLYKESGDSEQRPNTEGGVIKDSAWVECYCDVPKSEYTEPHSQLGIKYPSFLTIQNPVELGLKAKKHVYNVFNQYSPTLERYVYKYKKNGTEYARDFSTKRDIPVLYQDVCTGGRNIKSLDGWSVTTSEKNSLSNEYEYDTTEGTQSYLRWTRKTDNVLCNSGIFDNRKYIGTIVGDQEWLVEATYKYGPGASGFMPQLTTKINTPIVLDAIEIDTYTHFAWANSFDGKIDFSTSISTQKQYIGVYIDNNSISSTDPSKYSWLPFNGENPYSAWTTKLWKITIPSETWPVISEREFNLDETVQLQFVQSINDTYVDIKKCSLFRSMGQDEDGNYYTPDNISKLINTEDKTTYYYYNWEDVVGDNRITDKSELKLQAQVDSTSDLVETYIPVYTCEKTRAVTIEKSNYFNAIQTICESFKCWAQLEVNHNDETGKIENFLNKDYAKRIVFKEYINHPNYAGFKYGLNLSGITRTIKSDQIVTKLLVQPNNNEFAPNKVCTIQQAGANPTADTFIYDMRYYVNKKMLDALKWDNDLYITEWEDNDGGTDTELARNNGIVKGYYPALKYYNKKLLSISDALATASGALSEAEGRLSIAENGKKSAEDTLVKKLPEAIQKIPKTIKINDNSSRDVWLLGSGQFQMDWAWNNANHTQVKNNTSSGDSYSKGTNEVWRIAINHAPKDGSYGLTDIGLTVNETFVTDATDKLSGCGLDGITLTSGEKYIYGAFFRCENQKERYKYYLALTSVTQNLEAINDGEWHFYSTEETASNSGARLFIGTYPYEDKAGDRNLPVSFMCPILLLKEDWNTYISPLLKSRDYYINELPKAQEEVDNINERIKSLKVQYNNVLKKKLALNKSFFTKYKRFIQEGTWSNDKCIDPNLYYNDALVTLSNSSLPKVSYDIKVTDISGLEEYSDFHYQVGDETTIQDPDFFGWELDGNLQPTNIPKRETIIVSEATYNLQNPSKNTLKVQTYKTQFNDLFNQITASVQSVTYAQGGFERAAEFMRAADEEKSQFITSALNNATAVIQHGQTVTTDNTGIRLQDSIESNKMVHLDGSGILLSNDGGKTWRTCITADGITANVITSGVINTDVLRIMNGNDSTFMWNNYGLTAYYFESSGNRTTKVDYDKGVRFNRFGIYGTNNLVNETESLDEAVNKSTFALTWDGLKVSGNNGAILKIGKIKNTEGTNVDKILVITNGSGNPTFSIDGNGNVSLVGTIRFHTGEATAESLISNAKNTAAAANNTAAAANNTAAAANNTAAAANNTAAAANNTAAAAQAILDSWSVGSTTSPTTLISGTSIQTSSLVAQNIVVLDTSNRVLFATNGTNTPINEVGDTTLSSSIQSHTVSMAGWEVAYGWLLYRGSNGWGADGSMLLANGSRATGSKAFGGSGNRTDWTITSGSHFGVTKNGILYADSVYLTGGKIGAFDLSESALYFNKTSLDSGDSGIYIGTNGISISKIKLDSYGLRAQNSLLLFSGSYPDEHYSYGAHIYIGTPNNSNDITINADAGQLIGSWTLNSAAITTSDQTKKHSVEHLSDQYNVFFDSLKPCRFKYNDGTSNRYHTGFLAQEVLGAITTARLTTNDIGAYVEYEDNKEKTCGLRYSEFIALCVDQIQSLKKRIAKLEALKNPTGEEI